MIRDVDLVSYLPPFIAEYKEISVALEAENSEFKFVWQAAERVLYNEFIATADEYGISRFEKFIGIFPSSEDTLESRRSRVQAQWFNAIPYTRRSLENFLTSLCGENGYKLTIITAKFTVGVKVALTAKRQVDSVEELLERILPYNMLFTVELLYNTWEKARLCTWSALSNVTWQEMKEEVLP